MTMREVSDEQQSYEGEVRIELGPMEGRITALTAGK